MSAVPHTRLAPLRGALHLALVVGLAACGDAATVPTAPTGPAPTLAVTALSCTASAETRTVSCAPPPAASLLGAASSTVPDADIVGRQNVYVRLASSNVTGTDTTFSFDVTVQNLMRETIGSVDGALRDTAGVRVFFHSAPATSVGTGAVEVANAGGSMMFTAANQPYFQYDTVLAEGQTSAPQTWRFRKDPTVVAFTFMVYLATQVQPRLVINEVLSNPGGTISDANGEWVEIYNAGSRAVNMQGMLICDSAASGRRPYHLISSPLIVQPGGYVVVGNTTNTTNNGGVPVNYAYGAALSLANSLDAVKIARVVNGDTIAIDYVRYASAAVSAQNGIARELRNPALDNVNMDGSNWADATVTAVYGSGGRGTPGAQNSSFVP